MTNRRGPDGIHPVRVMSTAAHAVVELVMAFRLETIREGDQLPTIPTLADRLGVSAVVTQAALATLAKCGVLEVRRGRNGGIWLRDLAAITDALSKVMPELPRGAGYLEELLDVRRVLQTEAAIRTASRADDAIRSQLLDYAQRMARSLDRTPDLLKVGTQLNCAIALHCGSAVLADRLIRLIDEIAVEGTRAKRRLRNHPTFPRTLMNNQQQLVEAITRNDVHGIQQAVTAQMELSLSMLKKHA